MNTQRGFVGVGVLIAIILGVVVLGGGAYFVMQQQAPSQTALPDNNFEATFGTQNQNIPVGTTNNSNTNNATVQQEAKIPSSWVSYQNSDIGIAFSYPKTWGEIKTGKDGGCTPDFGYYGASAVQQMINEVGASDDPCNEVRLSANNKAFLSTWSKLYTKYPTPRGGDWGSDAGGIQAAASVETYCANKSKENCSVYKNSNGILVARSLEILGEGRGSGWIYVIKSAHPFYNGVILYAGVDSEYKKVIEQVVDGLRFLPYTPSTSSAEQETDRLRRWLVWMMSNVGHEDSPERATRLTLQASHLSSAQHGAG